jgi:hypothetical protein
MSADLDWWNPDSPAMTPAERKRRKPTAKRGHIALPGTGPVGETCGSCAHLYRIQMAKTYLKCGLARAYWTGGAGSDVRAGDAACSKWEAKP